MQNVYSLTSTVGLLILAAGCSTSPQIDYAKAGLVDVSGTVTMDGEPLSEALVHFETDDGRISYGRTDVTGHYELRFDSDMQGVIPGEKTVRISTSASTGDEAERGTSVARIETVPVRYNKESELRVEVKPGEAQTFDFDLESEGEVEQPEMVDPEDG